MIYNLILKINMWVDLTYKITLLRGNIISFLTIYIMFYCNNVSR